MVRTMKYLPLVWAALRRKPIRTFITFLSVTMAFTLFGLMFGLNATFALMAQSVHADRVWTMPRFDNQGMPIAVAHRVAQVPGVKSTTVMSYLSGYVGDPKNQTFVAFLDDEYGRIFPDWGPTPAQWDLIRKDRTAIVMSRMVAAIWHKKVGDTFTMIAPRIAKADGTHTWTFRVAAIGEDVTILPIG